MKRILISLLISSAGLLCTAQVEQSIMIAYQYLENEQYGKAWNETSELMKNKDVKDDDKEFVVLLFSQSGCFYAQDLLKEGSQGCKKAIDVCHKTLPNCLEKYINPIKKREALAWFKLGAYVYVSDYDSSYKCYNKAAALYREIGSKRDEAVCLLRTASVKRHADENENALELYAEAEKMAVESADTAVLKEILQDWQELLYKMGRMKERTEILWRMSNLGDGNVSLTDEINGYFNRGDDAQNRGDYKLAEQYFQMALQKSENMPEILRFNVKMRGLYSMAYLKFYQKEYAEALMYEEKWLEVSRQIEVSKEDMMFTYMMMADIYSRYGNKNMTALYIDSVNQCVGDNVELMILSAENNTSCLLRIGMNDETVKFAEYVDSVVVAKYGRYNSRRINMLMFQGRALHNLGMYAKSAEVYTECEEVALRLYGREGDKHIMALNGLANSLAFAGDVQRGAEKYAEMVRILENIVKKQMGNVTSSERESYWNTFSDYIRNMTSFGLKGNVTSEDFVKVGCESLIFSKALLLESEITLQKLVMDEGTKEDKELMRHIRDIQSRITVLQPDYAENVDNIVKLENELEKCERQLCAEFKEYAEYVNFLNVTSDSVINAMPLNSILIDYIDIQTPTRYVHAAYISRKKNRKISMELIFDWESVDALLDGAPIDVLYKDYLNDSARTLLWEPLSKYADDGCTIYYIPAGKMHQISLESFTAPDGKLLSEHYKFVRLTSARELVKNRNQKDRPASAALYGGLKYQMSVDSMLVEAVKYQDATWIAEDKRDVRSDSVFNELKYAQEEIDSIECLLKSAGIKVVSYTGVHGNEESFIALSENAPDILHLATHGYYFTPEEAETVGYMKGCDDAMMRSGLVMSGANAIKRGDTLEEGVRNGLLSAADIATMNLRGTDMVVLSACQSGLGKVTPEGVYGLQRAFKLAGVNTIVMTLWSVDDRVTKEFMVKFYERLVADMWDKRKAFGEARDHIRMLYSNSPYYWAGFVMVD